MKTLLKTYGLLNKKQECQPLIHDVWYFIQHLSHKRMYEFNAKDMLIF